MTRDEEDPEILSAFFASVVNKKASCSQGTQKPELQDRRRQNENLINQGIMVSNLLHHLDTHKGIEGAGGRAFKHFQTTSNHLSAVLAHQGGPRQMEVGKWTAHV